LNLLTSEWVMLFKVSPKPALTLDQDQLDHQFLTCAAKAV